MTMESKESFFNYTRDELQVVLADKFGAPSFRSRQLFEWVYRHRQTDVTLMTNLAKSFREDILKLFSFDLPEIVTRQVSVDGTRKYLFRIEEGIEVETVMIQQKDRMTLCVSSQYGCGMGCTFCQTGTMGFRKNLPASAIVGQVLAVAIDSVNYGDEINNIVFMGMGEPLHNFLAVSRAVKILLDEVGLAFGPRKITVSTVGLVPAIEKFGKLGLGVNLAVSLNATTNVVRDEIMPVNRKFPIEQLLSTLRQYPLSGRKKITIEYVMLHGVNDKAADCERLLDLLGDMRVKLNLIPYNENAGLGFRAPPPEHVFKWSERLNKGGISTTIRWSKGLDIDAACGQLATDEKARVRGEGTDRLRVLSNVDAAKNRMSTAVRV